MKYFKRTWNYFLIEPFKWVWYYFFQPDRFMKKAEELKASSQYRGFLFRLGLPTFLISYILVLAVQYISHFGGQAPSSIFSQPSNLLFFSFEAAIGTLLGVGVGIAWDLVEDIPIGVISSMWLSFWLGIWMISSWGVWLGILLSTIGGIALGIRDLGKYKRDAYKDFLQYLDELFTKITEESEAVDQSGSKAKVVKFFVDTFAILVGSCVFAFAGGIGTHIEEHDAKRIGSVILIGTAIGLVIGYAIDLGHLGANVGDDIFLGITFGIVGCIALVLFGDAISTIAVGLGGGIVVGANITLGTVIWANALTFVISIVPAIITGIAWFIGMSVGASVAGKFTVSNKLIFALSILGSFTVGCAVGIVAGYGAIFVFAICFILSSYRLPLYLVSTLSLLKVNRASKKSPSQVFDKLQGSALHWREQVAFPLLFLSNIMLIAAKQDAEQTKHEIQFIKEEKSLQIKVAWVGLLEIVFQALEKLKTLGNIAELTPFLITFMQEELDLLPSAWRPRFSNLYEASREASRYRNSLRWQTRRNALESMIGNLQRISYEEASSSKQPTPEDERNKRLESIVNKWLDRAEAKLKELEQEPHNTDQIDNPYVVGPVLALETSPFVGRRDIVQRLEQDLKRGSHRPTFFLSGERRMGKSSLLRQLPRLLDDHAFLPIFYDLQAPGVRSSAAAFLGTVSENIQKMLDTRGKQVEKLKSEYLREISLRNEAEVYFCFDEWLKKIEPILDREDLVLLLLFDEFESLFQNLEREERYQHIDLSLLLSWFRSVIQNRTQLALLFSGGRTIDEMSNEAGINWASYFVNVQTLKVSFLQENEARQLITQPISDYPIEQIFGNGVVDAIIYRTGCHPFLVQAVCSELVIYLNANSRDRAEIKDVEIAVDQVLEKFQATYFWDLWKRTDENQRACLIAITSLGEANFLKILQKSSLDEKTTRRTLQTLLKRDLIVRESDSYHIAAPIFAEWVENNS